MSCQLLYTMFNVPMTETCECIPDYEVMYVSTVYKESKYSCMLLLLVYMPTTDY